MREIAQAPLAERTTLRLGGPAECLIETGSAEELIEAVAGADRAGAPLLLLAGGSNLVIADQGWPGTVVAVGSRGVAERVVGDRVEFTVAAGEPWDELVARTVVAGLAGLECLSGIPGSVGATPIQNVGAYGEEVSSVIRAVRCWDRRGGEVVTLAPEQCGFGYRSSAFKGNDRWIVLEVTFALGRSVAGPPIRYAQLAAALGVELGTTVPASEVRAAVLDVRRSKGMVVDPADPDSVSAGSFFTNPILGPEEFAALERRVAGRLGPGVVPPGWPEQGGRTKTSAAWLIERAGFGRGYGDGKVGLSAKHTLALVNRGGASTAELVALAREVRDGVAEAFGVRLVPEPKLVGVEL
jgi:UDP-N-acetylmuramate dehydrogenase